MLVRKAGLAGLAVLWGCSFLYHEILLAHYQVLTLVWLRVTIGAVFLYALLCFRGQHLSLETHWKHYAFMGVFNNAIPFGLIVYAQQGISSGLASILNSATPIFTLSLAALCGLEVLTLRKGGGLVLGILGVICVTGWNTLFSGKFALVNCLALILATCSYAVSAVYARTRMGKVNFTQLACGMLLGASIATLPGMLLAGDMWFVPSPDVLVSLLLMGVGSTGLAYIIYFWLISHTGATNTMLVTMLVPLIACTLGVLVLGESFDIFDGLGMLLISVGVLLVMGVEEPESQPS